MRRQIAALAVVALTASCGPEAGTGTLAGIAGQVVSGGGQSQSDPRAGLTREIIEQSGQELILVSVPSRDAAASLIRAGQNGDKVTWISPDGIGLTFRNGILIATRGFGDDLMAADVSDLNRGLSAGRLTVRVHDYLDGEDQIVRRTFQCDLAGGGADTIEIIERSYRTRIIEERCRTRGGSFTNRYWIDGTGRIVQSVQFVSAPVGFVVTQRL